MNESTIIHSINPEQLQSMFDGLKESLSEQPAERYFTRKKVAEMLEVDNSTLHNWDKNGTLKSSKIGGRVVYRQSDIEAALKK